MTKQQIDNILQTVSVSFRFVAGLTQLLFILICTFISVYAPIVGKQLGRLAGKTIVLGIKARQWYEANAREKVELITDIIIYNTRSFIVTQFGDECPELVSIIRPATVTIYSDLNIH